VDVAFLGGDLFYGGFDVGFRGYVGLDWDDLVVLTVVFGGCFEDFLSFS
jgi:hypothetical protein